MLTGDTDTTPQAAHAHLTLLRQAGPTRRLALTLALSHDARELARLALRRRHPHADEQTLALLLVAQWYGPALAARLADYCAAAEGATDAAHS